MADAFSRVRGAKIFLLAIFTIQSDLMSLIEQAW